jgi:hypothetical protein
MDRQRIYEGEERAIRIIIRTGRNPKTQNPIVFILKTLNSVGERRNNYVVDKLGQVTKVYNRHKRDTTICIICYFGM